MSGDHDLENKIKNQVAGAYHKYLKELSMLQILQLAEIGDCTKLIAYGTELNANPDFKHGFARDSRNFP